MAVTEATCILVLSKASIYEGIYDRDSQFRFVIQNYPHKRLSGIYMEDHSSAIVILISIAFRGPTAVLYLRHFH
jgi:hypothetical protein